MTLSKKGSTRTNVQAILIATVILTGTRIAIEMVESNYQAQATSRLAWYEIPALTKEEVESIKLGGKPQQKPGSETTRSHRPVFGASKQETSSRLPRRRMALDLLFRDNQARKPVLVYYGSSSNAICRKMERLTFNNPSLSSYIEKCFYPVRIDFDKTLSNTEFAFYQRYRGEAMPSIDIISFDGRLIDYGGGYYDTRTLFRFLSSSLDKLKESRVESEAP